MVLKDRHEAGKKLAEKLTQYKGDKNAIVLGLPRGGVEVAYEIARELCLPLDVVVARKVGAPDNPEFAIGAVSAEGETVLDLEVTEIYGISKEYINEEIKKQQKEAKLRVEKFRGKRPPLDLSGKTAILVDDGVATGATMRVAILSAREKRAEKIVIATPVISPDMLKRVQSEVHEVVYLDAPKFFAAVGQFYEVFPQVKDEEVMRLLLEVTAPASVGAS